MISYLETQLVDKIAQRLRKIKMVDNNEIGDENKKVEKKPNG